MKTRQITIMEIVDNKLDEIVEKRRSEGSLVNTRQGVCSEAIIQLHEKEVASINKSE